MGNTINHIGRERKRTKTDVRPVKKEKRAKPHKYGIRANKKWKDGTKNDKTDDAEHD